MRWAMIRQTVPTPTAGVGTSAAATSPASTAPLGRQTPRLRRRRDQPRGLAVGRRRRLAALDVGQDVGLLDPSGRGLELRKIDAVLLGDLAGEGRRLDVTRGRWRDGCGPRRRGDGAHLV